MKIYFRY